MRRTLTPAVLALSLFSFSVFPQQAPTTGRIEGIVIRSDTEQPMANAQVTLSPPSAPVAPPAVAAAAAIASVTTGADGKFAFKDIAPASYRVAATANGFVRHEYGQRAPNGAGRLVFVAAGQSINDANIRITPAGTVSGRILDENGQPAVGAPVQLLRPVYTTQGKNYQPVGSAAADDRGNYRLFGVTPGHYYLMAGTLAAGLDLVIGLRGGPAARPVRYSPVYYPNVSKLDQASMIEVKAGSESSFDLRLKRETQRFHVRGRVISATGEPLPQDLTMMLGFRNPTGGSGSANLPNSFDPVTGMFDLANVPTGEFIVQVAKSLQPPGGGRGGGAPIIEQRATGPAASVPINVTNSDIDGLVLTLKAPVIVQGKLIVEGQPISAIPDLGRLRVNIRTVILGAGTGMPVSSTIAADGSFQVSGLRDDEYLAQMSANRPGFYVKSIKYGQQDILGKPFKVGAGGSDAVEVVLRAGTQTIAGTVTDARSQAVSGIAVSLVPTQRERLDLFRNVITDQSGKFTMTDLPPGEYKVFGWESVEYNALMEPDFLKPYEQLGKAITVTENSNSSIDVKVIPAQ